MIAFGLFCTKVGSTTASSNVCVVTTVGVGVAEVTVTSVTSTTVVESLPSIVVCALPSTVLLSPGSAASVAKTEL